MLFNVLLNTHVLLSSRIVTICPEPSGWLKTHAKENSRLASCVVRVNIDEF